MMEDELFFPKGFRFTCRMCGDCCKNDWAIVFDDEEKKAFEDADLSRHSESLRGVELFKRGENKLKDFWVVNHRDDSSCVLLDDEGCVFHRVVGYDKKNLTCRQFPAMFSRTPDGVFVGFSFACRSVRENYGEPVEKLRGEYEGLSKEYFRRFKSQPKNFFLAKNMELSWSAYKVLEGFLYDILDSGEPIANCLYSCSNFVEELKASGKKSVSEPDVKEACEKFSLKEPAEAPRKPFFARQQRIVLAFSVLPTLKSKKHSRNYLDTTKYYLRFVSGRGEVELKNLGRVNLEGIDNIEFDPQEEKTRELLMRYLKHYLHKKMLLAPPDVSDNLKVLLTGFALIRFYAACYAIKNGRQKACLEDVSDAVGYVDTHFLQHSKTSHALMANKITGVLLSRFMNDPDYEAYMLYPKPFTQTS